MEKNLINNYGTATVGTDLCEKDWCISPFPGKIQQVTLKLDASKSYDYACRYPVSEGDVAIVGYALPQYDYETLELEASPNTGRMGHVAKVLPKLTIKRSYAVEVDYVFTSEVEKKTVKECLKYLKSGEDGYEKTLQLGKHINMIRPITYYIRQILAAASVLAHPQLVTPGELELAKSIILEEKTVNEGMKSLVCSPTPSVGIDFFDIQVPDQDLKEKRAAFDAIAASIGIEYFRDGKLPNGKNKISEFLLLEPIAEHVKKYPHFGAVSIMIRGGFKNLLEAYLSVNPPIDDYYDEMCQTLEGVGHTEAYNILKAYKK